MKKAVLVKFAVEVFTGPEGLQTVTIYSQMPFRQGRLEGRWASSGGFTTAALDDMRQDLWSLLSEALSGHPSLLI